MLHRLILLTVMLGLFSACSALHKPEPSTGKALIKTSVRWPDPGSIPVCWYYPQSTTDEVRGALQAGAEAEYGKRAGIHFTGFSSCADQPNAADRQAAPIVRIFLDTYHTNYDVGEGSWTFQRGGVSLLGTDAGVSSLPGTDYSVRASAPKTWAPIAGLRRATLHVFLHELGHVAGLDHEHVRDDISAKDRAALCSKEAGGSKAEGETKVGAYDHNSLMNYCADQDKDHVGPVHLSATDLEGLKALYP